MTARDHGAAYVSNGPPPQDRLFVNEERTVLVRLWASGVVEVATRRHPHETWGPPIYLQEEA